MNVDSNLIRISDQISQQSTADEVDSEQSQLTVIKTVYITRHIEQNALNIKSLQDIILSIHSEQICSLKHSISS